MTVMSETPALVARSSFVQPLTAMSSAISCALKRTGSATVPIENSTIRAQCSHCQQQNTSTVNNANNSGATIGLPMTSRPVFHAQTGALLERLREERGWTQSEAASLAERRGLKGLSRQILLKLEKGLIKTPDPETLRAVAALYGVDYMELFTRFIGKRYGIGSDLPRHSELEESASHHTGGQNADETLSPTRVLAREHEEALDQIIDSARAIAELEEKIRRTANQILGRQDAATRRSQTVSPQNRRTRRRSPARRRAG